MSEVGGWIPNSYASSADSALNQNFIPGRYLGIQYFADQMLIVYRQGNGPAVVENFKYYLIRCNRIVSEAFGT